MAEESPVPHWPRSEGTLGVYGRYEYFTDGRAVYRSLFANPLEITGYRSGMRLVCPLREWLAKEAQLTAVYRAPVTRQDAPGRAEQR